MYILLDFLYIASLCFTLSHLVVPLPTRTPPSLHDHHATPPLTHGFDGFMYKHNCDLKKLCIYRYSFLRQMWVSLTHY